MSSAVAELDSYLQSMLQMKPPGVSGSKISSITQLCNANIQSESALITKIYTHFKRSPGSHKLGVLYVVDSVTRQWVEQARKAGQTPGPGAPDGTCAAGVNRVTELLPVLMTDIINTAPEDQKARIKKLVDIWERGNTFPPDVLEGVKEKLNAPTAASTTTPPGSPGRDALSSTPAQQPPSGQPNASATSAQTGAPNTSAILAALANMAKQNSSTPATGNAGQNSTMNVTNPQNTVPQNVSSVDQTHLSTNPPAVNPLAGVNIASQFPALAGLAQNPTPNLPVAAGQTGLLAGLMPQASGANGASLPPEMMQQLQVIQVLAAQGIPQEQWPTILALVQSTSNAANQTGVNSAVQSGWPSQSGAQNAWDRNGYGARDRHDYASRSPVGGHYRGRSRSPGWDRHRDSSPPRRGSPVYGEYDGKSPRSGSRDDYGRRGARGRESGGYRQRSPARRRSRSPERRGQPLPPPGPKHVEYDYSIGQGNIKVLSRTLFVGGVTARDNSTAEDHLRSIFSQFGVVQTCIVNIDKRHAFVKMISRHDAVTAREGMEHYKSDTMQLRTRWGVGFGPRDCSDYNTGISVIPIERLTEADRKWMLTAEYGGTGGKSIESGLVVEEPDIEIGAGVSSKAISRRMATDKSGSSGPRSTRPSNDRYRRPEREVTPARDNSNTIGVPPAVPGFGFQFPTMPNGMPMFPNFMMPTNATTQQTGQQQSQQPPSHSS